MNFLNKSLSLANPILDSGASAITVPEEYPLKNVLPNNQCFSIADGSTMTSLHKGLMTIGKFSFPAMTVANLQTPLISIKVLTDHDFNIYFTKENVFAIDSSTNLLDPNAKLWKIGDVAFDGTYRLTDDAFTLFEESTSTVLKDTVPKLMISKIFDSQNLPSNFYVLSEEDQNTLILHTSLGHLSGKKMVRQQLITNAQTAILKECPECILYKHKKRPMVKSPHAPHSQRPHHRLFADTYYSEDLFYDIPTCSKYYVTILVDEHSLYVHTNGSDRKTLENCSEFVNNVLSAYNTYHGYKALELRCDKGNEFNGVDNSLLEFPCSRSPTGDKQRNGLAERFVGIHKVQRHLITAHIPQALEAKFFNYTLHHATTLLNFALKRDATECPYNIYHKTNKKLPSNLPVLLEDVIFSTPWKHKTVHLLGAFLYFDPHSFVCHLMVQSPDDRTKFAEIRVSYYDIKRTYKLFSIKTAISEEMWKRNASIWGEKPSDWESSCIDVLTNKSFDVNQGTSYWNAFAIPLPTFVASNQYDQAVYTHNGNPNRKFNIGDSAITAPQCVLFKLKTQKDMKQSVHFDLNSPIFADRKFLIEDLANIQNEQDEQGTLNSMTTKLEENTVNLLTSQNNDMISYGSIFPILANMEATAPCSVYSVSVDQSNLDSNFSIVQNTSQDYTNYPKPPKVITNDITGPWYEPIQNEKQKFLDMKVFKAASKVNKGGIVLRPLWVHTIKPTKLKSRMVCFNPKTVHTKVLMNSAPVITSSAINILLALAARQGLDVQFFDIDNAFLYAHMPPGKYFIKTPPLFKDVFNTEFLELAKSAYGLQESPRAFYDHLHDSLVTKLGFTKNQFDPCLFNKGTDMMIAIHVDDGAIAGTPESIKSPLEELSSEFSFKRSDSSYLGLDFERLSQFNEASYFPLKPWKHEEKVVSDTIDSDAEPSPWMDPWNISTQFEPVPPDPPPPKTSGYGKYKILPEAYKTHFNDVTKAFTVPDLPPPGETMYSISTKSHTTKFLDSFIKTYPHLTHFMDNSPVNFNALLSKFAMPKEHKIDDFIEKISPTYGIPEHFLHLFPDGKNNRSLIGSLSYFVYRSFPSLCFAVTVLSRYNKYEHRTISYLIHCIIRHLRHITCSLKFFKGPANLDYVNLMIYSDASHNLSGKYYKGTLITLDHSPVLFKAATGRNKGHAGSTTQVELEAAHDAYRLAVGVKKILLDMKVKVNMFLFIDNLPVLRLLHHNSETSLTAGNHRLYDLRDAVKNEEIRAGYIPGVVNPADIYTKAFSKSDVQSWSLLESNQFLDWCFHLEL
ncbi:hypothetical protein QEN19_003383 [Hanseniaspora menglaensis]